MVCAVAALVLAIVAVALSAAAFVRAGLASKHPTGSLAGGHAELGPTPGGTPSLTFFDSGGQPRLEMGLLDNGTPFFDMRASDGTRSLLSISTNLRGGAPAISMRHPNHPATGWAVMVDDQGVGHVMQRDAEGSAAPSP